MKNDPQSLRAEAVEEMRRANELRAEMNDLLAEYGDVESLPAGQATHYQRLERGMQKLQRGADDLVSRAEALNKRAEFVRATLDSGNYKTENGFGVPEEMQEHTRRQRSSRPWQDLGDDVVRSDTPSGLMTRALDVLDGMPDDMVPSEGRDRLARALDREQMPESSAFVIAASDPAYLTAFNKAIRDPLYCHRSWTDEEATAYRRVEAMRAAMGESGSGTYLVPIPLDPNIVLTNAGIIDPVRELARVETTIAATWTGVKSAGSTATWKSENSAFTEANPTLVQLQATPQMLTAWLTGSYELVQDTTLVAQLPQLIADAFANGEGAGWINGTGSGQPQGIITAISATAGSTVTATTRGTFSSASSQDVFRLNNALNARFRKSKSAAWLASHTTINTIRQQGATYGSQFWAELGDAQPPNLLGYAIRESSSMPTTTTTGTVLALFADFSRYLIVDRAQTVVEYVSNVTNSSGVPTGTRGWAAWKRTTGLVEDTGAFAFLLT